MRNIFLFLFILGCSLPCTVFSQHWFVDPQFNAGSGPLFNTGVPGNINAIVEQDDEKVLVSGYFQNYNGESHNGIVRLNVDGSVDPTFDTGTGANARVYSIALQSDGKIIIAGSFSTYNAVSCHAIARLNTDGSLDTGFHIGSGAANELYQVLVQNDDRVLLCGFFTSFNGNGNFARIARLNSDGTIDTSFHSNELNSTVRSMALQPDGKVVVGGSFTHYGSIIRNRIARLNDDGTLDMGFDIGDGIPDANFPTVYSIAVDGSDGVILGGSFTSIDGLARRRLARLLPNGTVDPTFFSGAGANDDISVVSIGDNGTMLIGGYFTTVYGNGPSRLIQLTAQGSVDPSFSIGTGPQSNGCNGITSILRQQAGSLIVGGCFSSFDGSSQKSLVRLTSAGPASIQTTDPMAFELAPNPTSTSFSLFGMDHAVGVSLIDIKGRIIREWPNKGIGNTLVYSVAEVPSGLYFVRLQDQNGLVMAKKLVVE